MIIGVIVSVLNSVQLQFEPRRGNYRAMKESSIDIESNMRAC